MSASRPLIIIGGGAHARVVAEAARSRPGEWEVAGFVDPEPQPETARRLQLPQLASDADALRRVDGAWFVLGIGRFDSVTLRRELVSRYAKAGARWATVVHATAWVSPAATVAEGSVIFAGAVLNSGASVGPHSIINTGAIVEHDVKIGAFVMVAPGAATGGGVLVEDDCHLGLGCRVRDNVCIGRGTVVGMGAVVVDTLPAGVTAVGVPARVRAK